MEFINMQRLNENLTVIKESYHSKTPFKYVMFEGFFIPERAEEIYNDYPVIDKTVWQDATYLDQKNKFQKTSFEEGSVMARVFNELNSTEFTHWLEQATEIEETLIGDPELFGGGLHQSTNGAYLNVHIDYNIHPKTKHHRRLNVLVYMNKDWKDEYEGHLELWDLSDGQKNLLGKFAPIFNRMVIFETNEVSYHGHPKKLNTPPGINRKSIATYYYTKTRPEHELAREHSTISVNTEGIQGKFKKLNSGANLLLKKINKRL